MCFGVKSDGQIDQSQFDFKWAGIKQKIVGLHEVRTSELNDLNNLKKLVFVLPALCSFWNGILDWWFS